MHLHFYIDSKYEMCMRSALFFHNLIKLDVFKKSDLLRASFNEDIL